MTKRKNQIHDIPKPATFDVDTQSVDSKLVTQSVDLILDTQSADSKLVTQSVDLILDAQSKDLKKEFVNRKKELILRDYDSLFTVYGRQTTIIYNFRGWTITLLTVYFTFLFTIKPTDFYLVYLPGLFIILSFALLELSERSIMINLLQELRDLERIFMIENSEDFNLAVIGYEFRDLKDAKRPLLFRLKNFFRVVWSMKVIFWNLFLLLIYFIITYHFRTWGNNKISLPIVNKVETVNTKPDTVKNQKIEEVKKKNSRQHSIVASGGGRK